MRRFYPQGEGLAHVLGFTDIEEEGLEGVELTFNDLLSGAPGSRRVVGDRLGRIVDDVREIIRPVHGQDLLLSVDAGVQYDAVSVVYNLVEYSDCGACASSVQY